MNVTFHIKTFVEALNTVYLTVDKLGSLDSKNIFVQAVKPTNSKSKGTLYLFSTNYVNKSLAKIEAEVTESGSLPINPNQLYTALSKRADDEKATIKIDKNKCSIKIKRSNFNLDSSFNIQLGSQMKELAKQAASENYLELPAQQIIDSFKRAKNCISNDVFNINKIMLRSVLFKANTESITVEASDGSKGASIVLPTKTEHINGEEYLIPGDMTPILLNLCSKAVKLTEPIVKICKSNTELFIKSQDTIISTTLYSGKFPNIGGIISSIKTDTMIEVNTEELKVYLSRTLGFDTGMLNKGLISLTLGEKYLYIRPTSNISCEESIEYNSESSFLGERTIKISGKEFLAILNSSSNPSINLYFPPKNGVHFVIKEEIEDELIAKYVLTTAI